MNSRLVAAILPTNPVNATQQAFVLKTIASWFKGTPLDIEISKAQISQIIAASYGFKSFESFQIAQKNLNKDTRVLPKLSKDIKALIPKIESRLIKMKIQGDHKLLSLIFADYLIKITNNHTHVEYIHLEPSAFLNKLMQAKISDMGCWGENPFDFIYWANEVGHLGAGKVLMREHPKFPEQLIFYKKHLLNKQPLFGKVSYRTQQGVKQYSLPVLSSSKKLSTAIDNFDIKTKDYSLNKEINLLKQKDLIVEFLTECVRNPHITINPSEEKTCTMDLNELSSFDHLKEANITKISCSSTILDVLFNIGLNGNSDLHPFQISKEKKNDKWAANICAFEKFSIALYGKYKEFVFNYTFQISLNLEQPISYQDTDLETPYQLLSLSTIKPFKISHEAPTHCNDKKFNVDLAVKIKSDDFEFNSDSKAKLDEKSVSTIETFNKLIKGLLKQLNQFVFGNKYPMELAYYYLINNIKTQHRPPIKARSATIPPLLEVEQLHDHYDFVVEPKNLQITEPKIILSNFFAKAKNVNRQDRIKFTNTFLSRYLLTSKPLDSKLPSVKISHGLTKAIIIAYNKVLINRGHCINSKELDQPELDLISDHINFLLSRDQLDIYHDFDLSKSRYRFLTPRVKSKTNIKSPIQDQLKIKPDQLLSKRHKNALFDGSGSAKPSVINKRFDDFFSKYGLALLDEQSNQIAFILLNRKNRAHHEFVISYKHIVQSFGMPKCGKIDQEAFSQLNKLLTFYLKSGDIHLPSALRKIEYTSACFSNRRN